MIAITINKSEAVSSQIPFPILILSLYSLVRFARWKKLQMDRRERTKANARWYFQN